MNETIMDTWDRIVEQRRCSYTHTIFTSRTPKSEYPAEMSHIVAFLQGMHCLLRKSISRERHTHFWKLYLWLLSIKWTKFVYQTRRYNPFVHKALKYLLKSIFLELFLPLACIPLRPFLNTFTNFSLHILYKKCFLICVVSPGVSKFSLILLLKNNLYKSACTSFRGFPRMAAPSTCNHRNNIVVTNILSFLHYWPLYHSQLLRLILYIKGIYLIWYELVRVKTNKLTLLAAVSDQPGHLSSLIRVIAAP